MADSDRNLNVNVSVSGAQSAKGQLDAIADAERNVGSSATKTSTEIARGAREVQGAATAFAGFEQAAKGGQFAIYGLIQGIRGLGMEVATLARGSGPFAALVLTIEALGAAFIFVTSKINDMTATWSRLKSSNEDYEKRSKAMSASVVADYKAIEEEVKRVVSECEKLLSVINETDTAAANLAQAQHGLSNARLDISEQNELLSATSDDQRSAIRQKYGTLKQAGDQQFEADKDQAEIKYNKNQIEIDQNKLDNLREGQVNAEQERDKASSGVQDAQVIAQNAAKQLSRLQSEGASPENISSAQEALHSAARDLIIAKQGYEKSQSELQGYNDKFGGDITSTGVRLQSLKDKNVDLGVETQTALAEKQVAELKGKVDQQTVQQHSDALEAKQQARADASEDKANERSQATAERDLERGVATDARRAQAQTRDEQRVWNRLEKTSQKASEATVKHAEATSSHLERAGKALDRSRQQMENGRSFINQ